MWLLAALLFAKSSHSGPAVLDGARLTGTYSIAGSGPTQGSMQVLQVGANKLKVAFELYFNGGALAPSSGTALGTASLRGNVAIYENRDTPACKITLRFEPANRVDVTDNSGNFECGFGNHVFASGSYEKVSGRPPSFEFLSGGTRPEPTDPESVARRAEAARKYLMSLRDATHPAQERLAALAARRTQLEATISAQKLESDKRLRAGDALMKRAAAAKPSVAPSAAELLRSAKSEYEAARAAAREIIAATASLRETEDELVQLVATHNLAAADAKSAVTEIRTLTTSLTTQAKAEVIAAKKAASDANLAASRARSAAGVYSLDQFQQQRDKAKQDDELLGPELAAAASERASLEAASKPPAAKPRASEPKVGARK
jgi:hypothetical protein